MAGFPGSGATNLYGTTAPAGSANATFVGQFYVNTSTGAVYVATATGTGGWVLAVAGVARLATTGGSGYSLVNGTGNIITWTAPNDGALHTVLLSAIKVVATAETGGQITVQFTLGGTVYTDTIFAGGAGANHYYGAFPNIVCDANTTVAVAQATALTLGASKVYANISAQ